MKKSVKESYLKSTKYQEKAKVKAKKCGPIFPKFVLKYYF